MSTSLRAHTCKDLAQMAKRQGIIGWHSMRKEELVRALMRDAAHKKRCRKGLSQVASTNHRGAGIVNQSDYAAPKESISCLGSVASNLATVVLETPAKPVADRIVVMVRDPYWLHAYWELSTQNVQRARMALGQNWHGAKPILRLFCVTEEGGETLNREIEIHGGVNNWYIDVQEPPCAYRLEIGYAATNAAFYCLAKSNTVTTPPAGSGDSVDENWTDIAENADHIFAMSGGYSQQGTSLELRELLEERLQRPMGSPVETRYGVGAARALFKPEDLQLAIDAELVIFGACHPAAHLTVKGEPVKPQPDGTFTVRMALPNRRQVIPVVASSPDGSEQRTVILGVERNTKALEPVHRDTGQVGGCR